MSELGLLELYHADKNHFIMHDLQWRLFFFLKTENFDCEFVGLLIDPSDPVLH